MQNVDDYTSPELLLVKKATEQKAPLYLIFELTPLCNMNCDMCYVRLSREQMERKGCLRTASEWLETARQAAEQGTMFILLTGGEPLLYPEFQYLYLELRKMGMILTVNTNGTLIDEAWSEFFSKNRPRRINITLYGASENTYAILCHYREGYRRALHGIELLKEKGVSVKINGSLTAKNRRDGQRIVQLAKERKIFSQVDTYMYPASRERGHSFSAESRMSPEEAAKENVRIEKNQYEQEIYQMMLRKRLSMIAQIPRGVPVSGKISCRAGKSSAFINWQGELRPCVMMEKPSVLVSD